MDGRPTGPVARLSGRNGASSAMSSAEEFRARAAQWRERAARCADAQLRRHFEEIAREWEGLVSLAEQQDRDSPAKLSRSP